MKKIKNNIFISIIIICVVLSFLLLYYINRKVVPILEKYGESTMNNILRATINDVVKSEFKNKNLDDTYILGPSPGMLPKINNVYNLGIILKYKNSNKIFNELRFINEIYRKHKINVDIDINPIRI